LKSTTSGCSAARQLFVLELDPRDFGEDDRGDRGVLGGRPSTPHDLRWIV